MVLNDFQRGKLPYFVKPPGCTDEPNEEEVKIEDLTNRDKLEKEEKDKQEEVNKIVAESQAETEEGNADEGGEVDEEKKKPQVKKVISTKKKLGQAKSAPANKRSKEKPLKRKLPDEYDGVSLKKKKMKPTKNSKKNK